MKDEPIKLELKSKALFQYFYSLYDAIREQTVCPENKPYFMLDFIVPIPELKR
jgi:hypothetical protein